MDEATRKELSEMLVELYKKAKEYNRKALSCTDPYIVGRLNGGKDELLSAYNRLKGILDRDSTAKPTGYNP